MALGALALLGGARWTPLAWAGLAWWFVLLAALIVEGRSLRSVPRLSFAREVEPVISLGTRNPVTLKLWNRAGLAYYFELRDEPPLEFTAEGEAQAGRLQAGEELQIRYHVTPPRRGNFSFGGLTVRLYGDYRLLRRQVRWEEPQSVKVYPRLDEIREHELALRKDRLLDIGLHMARLKGAGLEFESLRDYQPGDEMRRVDWKATARHGHPLTREYEVERSQHIVLALDLGRTMASRLGLLTKVDHAVNAAALLAYVAASLGDWVGLYSFAGEPLGFTPRASTSSLTCSMRSMVCSPRGWKATTTRPS